MANTHVVCENVKSEETEVDVAEPLHLNDVEDDGEVVAGWDHEVRRTWRWTAHEHQVSKENGDLGQFTGSPARNDNMGRRVSGESAHQRHGGRGSSSGQPVRQSVGSEHSIERSPLHPHHQAQIVGKGSASPSWEGKNSYDGSHGTPGRSRLKPRGDETPDRDAAGVGNQPSYPNARKQNSARRVNGERGKLLPW
ncbi:hypothetical protein CsSME_00009239 [Camellia sinensis var. sinensis]